MGFVRRITGVTARNKAAERAADAQIAAQREAAEAQARSAAQAAASEAASRAQAVQRQAIEQQVMAAEEAAEIQEDPEVSVAPGAGDTSDTLAGRRRAIRAQFGMSNAYRSGVSI